MQNKKKEPDRREQNQRTLRYTTLLFCILVTACYALYFRAKTHSTKTATTPTSTQELSAEDKNELLTQADDQFVAEALAWEDRRRELLEEKYAPARFVRREDPRKAHEAYVEQLRANIKEIGTDQPGLRKEMIDRLEAAADLPL